MNTEQLNFLEEYMDDYQIKKIKFLIDNAEFESFFDFLEQKKESYKNIEEVETESSELLEILNDYKPLEETTIVKIIQDDIVQKNKLLDSLFDFANEEISDIKASYEEKIKNNNKNLFVSGESIDFNKKSDETNNKLKDHLQRHQFATNSLYAILLFTIIYKVVV